MSFTPVVTFGAETPGPSQPSPWTLVDQGKGGASEFQSNIMNSVLKPYFTLACVAFVVGFVSYLGLGWLMTPAAPTADDWQASISASAPLTPVEQAPLARGKVI